LSTWASSCNASEGRLNICLQPSQEERVASSSRFVLFSLIVVPVAMLAAWRQEPHLHDHAMTQDADWTALMGSMGRMHAAMASIEPTGNRDLDFVKLMLPHHQGAVEMAESELLNGEDAQMRRLAQEIITDQESEMQLMQVWLQQHRAISRDPSRTPGADAGKEQ
jgi:hypothetical protein